MCILLFFASNYIILTCDKLLFNTNLIEEKVSQGKWDDAHILSFQLLDIYEGHVSQLSLFLNHSEMDIAYGEVLKLTQYTKESTKDESLATIHILKAYIKEVKNMEKVTISNVF